MCGLELTFGTRALVVYQCHERGRVRVCNNKHAAMLMNDTRWCVQCTIEIRQQTEFRRSEIRASGRQAEAEL